MTSDDQHAKPPPQSAVAFLEWYCDQEYLEEIQGDLHELHLRRLRTHGGAQATCLYWLEVIRFFRPYLLKRKLLTQNLGGPFMFQNYAKIAFRNLRKHKGYSFINISGLVTGLAVCILILLFVRDELSFDRFHEHAERIYRVTHAENTDGQWRKFAYNFGALGPLLETHFPEIEHTVRIFPNSVVVQRDPSRRFQEPRFMFADSTFFDLFSFAFKNGSPATALDSPYDIVLSGPAATKYFGEANPVGETLTVEGKYDFRITGVLETLPSNSHLKFDFIAAMGSVRDIMGWALTDWHYPPMYIYVKLAPKVNLAAVQPRLPNLIAAGMGEWAVAQRRLDLQPLLDIHLNSDLEGELGLGGSMAYVSVFTAIACLILLIACTNYMNLATARSASRAREVGLRKVIGAQKKHLVRQFLGESLTFSVLSLLVAILLVEILLPEFNLLMDKQLAIDYSGDWTIWLAFAGLALLVGLISGCYPAIFLSRFEPNQIFQATSTTGGTGGKAGRLRAALVFLQFTISIALIACALVVNKQMRFVQQANLGFQQDQIVILPIQDESVQINMATAKQQFESVAGVVSVTATSTIPGIDRDMDFPARAEGLSDDSDWQIQTMMVDHDFVKTFGMEIVTGRDFSRSFTTDTSSAFVLNETALKKLGWDVAIGKRFGMLHLSHGKSKNGRVIGVVRDFHFRSMHHAIAPLALQISPDHYYLDNIAIKIRAENVKATLAGLEAQWRQLVPQRPFQFTFLDDVFGRLYHKEQKLGSMFGYFSVLAVFIGCLGLFGLASFSAEQRTREIGIRKVMGATTFRVVTMLSVEIVALVAAACLVAGPLGYFAMNAWLQDFSYRISLEFSIFLLAGAATMMLALLTISYQAIKAARTNPTQALRHY